MFPAGLRLCPILRRLASLCAFGGLCLVIGCEANIPMERLLLNGPPAPGPLSTGMTPDLMLTSAPSVKGGEALHARAERPSGLLRASHQEKQEKGKEKGKEKDKEKDAAEEAPAPAEAPVVLPANAVPVNLDVVLRMTYERNGDILVSRERVNEAQAAWEAAVQSCMPQALRKDVFKKPVAEATLWRRRAELRKVENDNLQDAANTYFDWLTAQRGEAVARDLMRYEQRLHDRARKTVETGETPARVVVEATQTALNGRRQFIARTHQQGEAAASKLAYLMGLEGGVPTASEPLEPIDRIDVTVPLPVLVRQAQDNGPGVRELQGLAASIAQGIDEARAAQCLCEHTGAAMICGRLQMAQSQLQQAQLSLVSLHAKLRAGVEESMSAVVSGREQISRASDAIGNAAETYRILDERLQLESPRESMRNNTYNAVLTSIQQLSQAHANYLTAVSNYDKAQARLLLLLGNYANGCPAGAP